jgi:HAMP domain-containing protein
MTLVLVLMAAAAIAILVLAGVAIWSYRHPRQKELMRLAEQVDEHDLDMAIAMLEDARRKRVP